MRMSLWQVSIIIKLLTYQLAYTVTCVHTCLRAHQLAYTLVCVHADLRIHLFAYTLACVQTSLRTHLFAYALALIFFTYHVLVYFVWYFLHLRILNLPCEARAADHTAHTHTHTNYKKVIFQLLRCADPLPISEINRKMDFHDIS